MSVSRARNCRDVATLLGVYEEPKTHSIIDIEAGIRKYHEEHGKSPSETEDATPYIGYKTTWRNVKWWLRNNGHGTWPEVCQRLGFEPLRFHHSLENIEAGMRKYHNEHGKPPTLNHGDAAPYVGYPTTWKKLNGWLRRHGHGSLSQCRKQLGLKGGRVQYVKHSLSAIEGGARKYYEEQGKSPSTTSQEDASSYMGYSTNWRNMNMWLRNNGHGGLRQLLEKTGLPLCLVYHELGAVEQGVRKYRAEHGNLPASSSGDAGSYVGYSTTWGNVNSWLWSRDEGGLHQFCKKLGLE